MKKHLYLLFLFALLPVFFSSCSLEPENPSLVYVVTVSDDYVGFKNQGIDELYGCINDAAAFNMQYKSVNPNAVFKAFISNNGKKYITDTPVYKPVNENKQNTDRSNASSFMYFYYNGQDPETKWTKKSITDYIESLANIADENDLLIFYYSGHGAFPNGELIITDLENKSYEGFSAEELYTSLDLLSCKKLILIDACYSGNYITFEPYLSTLNVYEEKKCDEDEFVEKLAYISPFNAIVNFPYEYNANTVHKNIWTITAAGADGPSYDSCSYSDFAFRKKFGNMTQFMLSYFGYDLNTNTIGTSTRESYTAHDLYEYIWNNFPMKYKTGESAGGYPQIPRTSLTPFDLKIVP